MRSVPVILCLLCLCAPLGAQVGEPDPEWVQPDERATHDYLRTQLPYATETSLDPYVLLIGASTAARTSETGRDQAWFLNRAHELASSDPLVLWRLASHCRHSWTAATDLCKDTDWLARLSGADPANGAPHLHMAYRALERGDAEAAGALVETALARPELRGYRDEHMVAMYHALHSIALKGQSLDPFTVAVYASSLSSGLPDPVHILGRLCSRGAIPEGSCRELASRALDGPVNVSGAGQAVRIYMANGPEPGAEERERLDTIRTDASELDAGMESFDQRFHGDRDLLELFLSDLALHGELEAFRRVLASVE